MSLEEHRKQALKKVSAIIVTVSDTRKEETDECAGLIKDFLAVNSHKMVDYMIIKNDGNALKDLMEKEIKLKRTQVIIFNGGTGLSSKDITVTVLENFFDRKIDGFGELFRYLSYNEIGTAALLSRTCAGVARGILIICLPGSPKAVKLALDKLILPELGHMVKEIEK